MTWAINLRKTSILTTGFNNKHIYKTAKDLAQDIKESNNANVGGGLNDSDNSNSSNEFNFINIIEGTNKGRNVNIGKVKNLYQERKAASV